MDEFESPIDKIIREAREKGAFENLPGKGKPVQWEDESQVPEDQRLAHRVIKNSGFTLDWIDLGKELDSRFEAARRKLENAREARRAGGLAAEDWDRAVREYKTEIEDLNRAVIGYNLRAPGEQFHRRPYPRDPEAQ